MWNPTTQEQLAIIVEDSLNACTQQQAEAFSLFRVPFQQVPIRRGTKLENVIVVAYMPAGPLYYDDIEGGFELAELDACGVIVNSEANQFKLNQVLSRMGF